MQELTTGSTYAGRYQIIEELGKGGMGRVYKVFDTEIKEKIALKLLKPEIGIDEKMIERFRNELKLARKISQRNVCRMHDLSKEEGAYYITMEYVVGEDLKRLIRKVGQMSAGKTISIAKQVCEGLAEAHSLGIVHRDLKPQNIMVDEAGNAKIMDFGIARSLKVKGITGAGVMIGTPEYMSPEQVEGKEVDQRSDIYSLGVILYEMVTGRVPFEGDTPFTIGVKHKSEIPRNPKEFNAQIPEELNRLILKCLEKDKEKRYQSAEDLHAELSGIEKGIPAVERVVPKRKPFTSKEITVTFGMKKVLLPALGVAFLVIAAVVIWQIFHKKEAPVASAKKSIAVLPFVDLSQTKTNEYLCDGISETLINALTNIEGLWVPAQTSAFSFKGKTQDIREIGQKLGVENVLEGSVQVAGDNLRVTARISNAQDGRQVWSEIYNRKMADMFAIQDDIAKAIVTELEIKLLGEKSESLIKNYTENLEAYNLYLQGRYFWNKRGREDLYKSIEYFEKSLEKDPDFVLAYAGLADSYSVLGSNSFILAGEVYPRAREFALKALELDNRLAEAHATLASVMSDYDWDWAGSEEEYKLAIQLNPGYGHAHHYYAFLLSTLGRHEEAIEEIKKARDLDPLAPRITANVGFFLYIARKYDQALEELKKAIELYPEHGANYSFAAWVYTALGRYEEALASLQRYGEITGEEPFGIIASAYVYAKWGKREEAERLLQKIREESEKTYTSPTLISFIYGALGDYDRAFSWLEKAYSERDGWLCLIKVSPWSDPLRSDPRFKALLRRMNLD